MKKRRYHATSVNQVNWAQLAEQAGDQRVVFAVDAAKVTFVAVVMTPDKQVLKTIKWKHPEQTKSLLEGLFSQWDSATVQMAIEPTGTYGDALREAFERRGIEVYRVSPKAVRDSAELIDGVPSQHDAKAAYQIGWLHLNARSARWELRSEQRRLLGALLEELKVYQERRRSSLNRLEAQLARHWPELPTILGLGSVSLMTLLARFGSAAQVAAEPEEAEALLRRCARAALSQEKIAAVIDSARQSLGVPCIEAERRWVQGLAEDLLAQHRAVQRTEKAIAQQVEADPVATRLAEVVGKTTAAVLIECIGEPEAYPNAASYLKALGLNLKERSSGKHVGALKITKRGPGLGRFYLYFAVLRQIAQDSIMRAWHQAKTARDGGHKGKSIVALMRKLAKALWHVGRGERFDTRRLFDTAHLARAA